MLYMAVACFSAGGVVNVPPVLWMTDIFM